MSATRKALRMHTITESTPLLAKLNDLLERIWERNPFYTDKLHRAGLTRPAVQDWEHFEALPFTTRQELLSDQRQCPPLGSNLTVSFNRLSRTLRSSGTGGTPLYWGDTDASRNWLSHCSRRLFEQSGVTPDDHVLFTGKRGNFSGPWIMHDGARALGCCCVTSLDGLEQASVFQSHPIVVVGKPTRLLDIGKGLSLRQMNVSRLILTGEPSPQPVRDELESLWDAPCLERYGCTEAGSIASECPAHTEGMHLLDDQFIAEVIDPETQHPLRDDSPGELVLTTLGRVARPIIRYRTGDQARLTAAYDCPCGRRSVMLIGGVTRLSTVKAATSH